MPADLTLFGRLALQWDAIHPYNAAQLMRVASRIAPAAAQEAWNHALRSLHMGSAVLSPAGVQHQAADELPLETVPEALPLESHLTAQMNLPYPVTVPGAAQPYQPFRAFLKHDHASTWLGVIYHHPIADSVSIRLLMRQWACHLLDPGQATSQPMQYLPAERQAPLAFFRGLREALRWAKASKQVRRLPAANWENQSQRCFHRTLPQGTPQALYQAAHHENAKVGDLLLASLAYACSQIMPAARQARTGIAVGAIRDTRQGDAESGDLFGMRLGFGNLILGGDALQDRRQLLAQVAQQTHGHRSAASHAAARLELRIALAVGRHAARERLLDFYRKRLPLSGGLSNVNLTRSWVATMPGVESFLRISPTGPILPIVLTPTTLGEQLNLAVTWREGALNATQAHQLADLYIEHLLGWCHSS